MFWFYLKKTKFMFWFYLNTDNSVISHFHETEIQIAQVYLM